ALAVLPVAMDIPRVQRRGQRAGIQLGLGLHALGHQPGLLDPAPVLGGGMAGRGRERQRQQRGEGQTTGLHRLHRNDSERDRATLGGNSSRQGERQAKTVGRLSPGNKKPGCFHPGSAGWGPGILVDHLNALGLHAFLALYDFEADLLAFGQGLEAVTFDGTE
ncbi:hypothetical protein BGU91_21500, partial [Clostridioides difficile]